MSWQEFLNSDGHEQEQLNIYRALIVDATKDTTLWVQADPSEEERVHVLAIQTGLADLSRIIERRMERRKETRDDWVWSETVAEVLSRLDKAREARGEVVGKSLACLAQRLPKELPGSKVRRVTQAPAPPTALRGTGGWAPAGPKPTQKPPNPPTRFPVDLWPRTCIILDEAIAKYPDRSKLPELCGLYISMMTPLYCEAVNSEKMKAHAVLREGFGGMLDLLDSLLTHNDDGRHSGFGGVSNEAYRIYEQARNSKEFGELEKAIADAGVEPRPSRESVAPAVKTDSPVASPAKHGGRPRKDSERNRVLELKNKRKSWREIKIILDKELNQNKSKDAYRALASPRKSE